MSRWQGVAGALGAAAALSLAAASAGAQPATPPAKAQTCAACHGVDGNSSAPLVPVLAGQNARYLYFQLRDFQEGRRGNDPTSPPVHASAGLSRDEMRELADWFAKQKPKPTGFRPDPEKARLGKQKADETLCTMCHQGGFAGQNEIPRVAGQHHDYIVKQFNDFKQGKRTNDAGNMTAVAHTLSEKDIENLANYLAGL